MPSGYLTVVACAVVLTACSGLDRDTATSLIRDRYFAEGAGVPVSLDLEPSGFMLRMDMIGNFSVAIGDCGRRAIGWPGRPSDLGCIQALAAAGAVHTCSTGRVNALATGPSLQATTPMTCGSDMVGMDAITEFQHRIDAIPEADRRFSHLSWVAEFSTSALTEEACTQYLDRAETAVLEGSRSYHPPEHTWLVVVVPGTSRFVELTGIADGASGTKIAEFTWSAVTEVLAPLQAAGCALRPGQTWPTSTTRTARATFRRYDDGWRIETVDWGAH